MALYTATIVSKVADPNSGNLNVLVSFSNGNGRTIQRMISGNDLDLTLKNQCLRIAEQLEAQDAALASIPASGQIIFR